MRIVDGNHFSCLEEPQASALLELILQDLAEPLPLLIDRSGRLKDTGSSVT